MSDVVLRSGVEVWSDTEAAGGTPQSVFTEPLRVTDYEEIPDNGHVSPRDQLTAEASAEAAAMDDVTQGKVLRVELSDGEAREWRVWKVTTDRSGGELRATIECRHIAWDLFTRTPLLEITEAGMKDTDFAFKGLTPAEWIDDLILVTTDWPSWIVKGTVEATTRHSLNVDWTHAGPLLDKLAELSGHEWTLRRNGSTDYRIDVLAERGASSARPIIAANLNLLSAARDSTAESQATRVYPQGGGAAGFKANMGEARWTVDLVDGSDVMVSDPAGGDGPVGFDDQLGGFSDTSVIPNRYLEKADGTTTEITDSVATNALFAYSPGDDTSRATFDRNSEATYFDSNGVRQTAAVDVLRDDHWVTDETATLVRSTKLEASRTNELHNSTSPATQTRSLTAGTYTLWIEGSGSVDADGATDGAYGTATEGQANDLVFTVSATQDVTFTVTGTVDVFQCEEGSFRSSLIETAGASDTRSADSLSYDISGTPLATPQEMTVYCKFVERGTILSSDPMRLFRISDTSNNFAVDNSSGGGPYRLIFFNGSVTQLTELSVSPAFGDVVEIRAMLRADGSLLLGQSIEGAAETTSEDTSTASLPPSWSLDTLAIAQDTDGTNTGFNDFIPLKVASGVRTMDEMRDLVASDEDVLTVADATGISADDLVAIRANSASDELIFLEHPTNKDTYGLYSKTLERADVPDIQNLLSDVADAYLDTDTDADGLADGWNEIGTPTTTMDTDAANHKHGTGSQKVVASVDEGIESDPITIDPTTTRPYFAAEGRVKAESGTVQIHIVDATNNNRIYPRSEIKSGRTPNLGTIEPITSAPAVDFEALGTTQIKVRFVARAGSSTFWVDGASLVQQQVPVGRVVRGRGANVLWQAANDHLLDNANPEDRWDIDPIDLYRANTSRWPDQKIEPGQTVIVKDTGLNTDAELRVVARERDLLVPGRVSVTVDHRPKTLAERINPSQIDQLFDDQPATSGATRTEGTSTDRLNAGSGPITSTAAGGLYIYASSSTTDPVNQDLAVTAGDIILAPLRAGTSFTIQSLEIRDSGGGAGTARTVIYSDNGYYPDTLLYESSDLTLDGVANQITDSGPIIAVDKDQTYWVGVQVTNNSSGTASMGHYTDGMLPSVGFGQTFGVDGFAGLRSTGNGSTVPDLFPASAVGSENIVFVGIETP